MGRWDRRDRDVGDGWYQVQRGRGGHGGGQSGNGGGRGQGGGGGGGNRGGGNRDVDDKALRDENNRLKSQLVAAQRDREAATDRTVRPSARDTRPRDGDWACIACNFQSNKAVRGWCYRCAHPKAESFPPNSRHVASSTGVAAAGGAGVSAPPAVDSPKALRDKLERLRTARAAFEDAAGCDEQVRRIDQDIASVRSQLEANLPVEVAVKGTLVPVAQARAAVQRAEAKVSKLEGQVVALMAAHAAAQAELADQRDKLSAAEAATARAATSALPQGELAAALVANPAAVWSALLTSIQMRVLGMPQAVIDQLQATTAAMQQACSLLPELPVVPAAAGVGGGGGQQAAEPTRPVHQAGGGTLDPAEVAKQAEEAAAARAAAAAAQFQQQQQQAAASAAQYELERRQRQLEAVAASSAASLAQSQLVISSAEDAIAASSPLGAGVSTTAGGATHAVAESTPVPTDDAAAEDGQEVFRDATDVPIRDDSMGGGADDQVARKRALENASRLVVAARAKAKAAAQGALHALASPQRLPLSGQHVRHRGGQWAAHSCPARLCHRLLAQRHL